MPADNNCEVIAELRPDSPRGSKPMLVQECGDSIIREVYDSFKDKAVKIKVDRNSGPDAGSGFFVGKGDEVLTAYHVIKNTNDVRVELSSGATVSAHVEKIDPAKDLALLKVDVAADPSRAANIDTSLRDRRGDYVFGLGAPGITNEKQVLSIGTVNERLPLSRVLDGLSTSNYAGLISASRSGDAQTKQDVADYVGTDRIVTAQTVIGGQSGGALLDGRSNVVGVITDSLGDQSLAVPADKIAEFLNSPSPYRISFEKKSAFDQHPVSTLLSHGFMGASMLPGMNKVAPLFVAGTSALGVTTDYENFKKAASPEAKWQLGRVLAEDAGFMAGGLALTAGVWGKIPALKYAGMATFGAATLASAWGSVEKHPSHKVSATRSDGGKPFLWDMTIAGTKVD